MRKLIVIGLLVLSLLVLFFSTLCIHPAGKPTSAARLNLTPLVTVEHYVRDGGWGMMINIVGNLAAFFPLGFLLPWLGGRWLPPVRVVLLCMALSLLIEMLQYCSGWRIADVDDVILNSLGGLLGYLAFVGCRRMGRRLTTEHSIH